MSEAEQPDRLSARHRVTVEDIHRLMGASTPHFALQLRNRIRRLIAPLPSDDPARVAGERAIRCLEQLGEQGEFRGTPAQPDEQPLPSLRS